MKKIIVFLIIGLFLLGVVSAQSIGVKAKEKKLLRENVISQAKSLGEASNSSISLKQRREIAQDKLAKAKESYVRAKEKYVVAKGNYVQAQNGFKQAKAVWRGCQTGNFTGNRTADCSQIQEQITERAKEFLLNSADRILEHLNKIKAKVESSEDLTEEEAAEIIAKIDDKINDIENAKAAVETSEDKKEIIEATKTIKQEWRGIRKRLAVHTGRIINSRIGGIIVKVKHLETKLDRILKRMEEKGIDTSEIQPLVDDFNEKVDEAEEHYEMAVDKFNEAKAASDVETAHQLAVEGHTHIKEAHKALQDAQHLLRDIVVSIKQSGGDLAADDEDVEEEPTEETE